MDHPPLAHPPARPARSFAMVIKPVGSRCNLACRYCYYVGKERRLGIAAGERISDGLLAEFMRQYIEGQDFDLVRFNWHGGEPTLAGLDFFRDVVRMQREFTGPRRIHNELQTNGVLLDEAWCEFLKEHQFLVGLSIDGPGDLHDGFRRDSEGRPTFDRVVRAARLLHEYDVPFNTLTVVHSENAKHPDEVYRFLVDELGSCRLQWLPCVAPKDFHATAPGKWDPARMPVAGTPAARPGNADSAVTDWSVDPDDWGEFLCRTFDLWRTSGLGKVTVHWFESLVAQWMGHPAHICSLAGVCGRSLVTMEMDGSLYSCDHFVFPEYRLGHLNDQGSQLVETVYSQQQREFGCAKNTELPNACRQCPYLFACHGECPKNRFLKTPDGQPGLNYLCSGNRRFFSHADPHLRQIAAQRFGCSTVVGMPALPSEATPEDTIPGGGGQPRDVSLSKNKSKTS